MTREKKCAAFAARRVTRTLATIALAALMVAPVSYAQAAEQETLQANIIAQSSGLLWEAPTSAASVDDGVVTVGSHLAATANAEILGLNETVYPAQDSYRMNAATLAEAQEFDRLGVFGSEANETPNPYLANLFYNYYADENELQKSAEAAIFDEQTKANAYIFYIEPNPDYGTPAELALRPDIVMGVSNSTGQAFRLTMNYDTTDAINHTTWGTGASTPSQPYMCVLDIRRHTDDESLVGTRNSDGNLYDTSWYYREADETYDPIAVFYNRGVNESGIDYAVENTNKLACAAKLALQQDASKRTRYEDPVLIANDYERFVKALKWAILARQEAGQLEKKTVAVVARVLDGKFRLIKMNPDGDTTMGFREVEASQDTVNDLAAELFPEALPDLVNRDVTAEQLMQADVVICVPPLAGSYKSSAQDVREALSSAGFNEEQEGYPAIFDNKVPTGTFGTIGGMYDSAENAMLVGLIQGFIYPEVFESYDSMVYFASKFFHLKDQYVKSFVSKQLDGITLAGNHELSAELPVADSITAVQEIIDEGVAYYYGQDGKSKIDAARPRIQSSDLLDDSYEYGVSKIQVSVPEGATFTLTDVNRLIVPVNEDGTYTIDDSDATTLTVSLPGYRDYSKSITGSQGNVVVQTSQMTATKEVSFKLPAGATVAWVKNAKGQKVPANSDGTYTLDAASTATFSISLEGYDDYEGVIRATDTSITLSVSNFLPKSTATTINVPDRATLVVKDSTGKVVSPGATGTYKLFNGYTYTITVSHPRYEVYTASIVGGEKAKFNVRLASMTARIGKTALTIDKSTVSAADINEVDAEVVQSITLGPSVKAIDKGAFKACANLKSLTFGSKVTKIGANAFEGLALLSTVKLNAKLQIIGASAFAKCTELSSMTIPAQVTTIGASAFSGCTKLKKLVVTTKKLKKTKVKNSLKNSSVTVVKVKVGKTSVNKTYVKKYKKIFKKGNCGKKVTVKK